ncbi:MAG: hypothetical protein ACFFBD_19790 [Candidatus Hodarchaeota archaeon]
MKKNANKYYVYAITAFSIIILAYSIWILQSAMQGVIQGTNSNVIWEIIIGLVGIGLALSTLMRVRGKILISQNEKNIVTVIECPSCNIKKINKFQKGDYITKIVDKCSKCENNQVITAIYMEKPEKK